MNQKIRKLEEDIISVLNSYGDIPIETKRLVLLHVTTKVKDEADKIILMEMAEAAQLSQPISETGELKDAEST